MQTKKNRERQKTVAGDFTLGIPELASPRPARDRTSRTTVIGREPAFLIRPSCSTSAPLPERSLNHTRCDKRTSRSRPAHGFYRTYVILSRPNHTIHESSTAGLDSLARRIASTPPLARHALTRFDGKTAPRDAGREVLRNAAATARFRQVATSLRWGGTV